MDGYRWWSVSVQISCNANCLSGEWNGAAARVRDKKARDGSGGRASLSCWFSWSTSTMDSEGLDK